ncbi:MAG: hypothetical protein K8R58_15375 [Bacteroidales bacterium]|nr:hypothetical protein [Bacteroidales bacterium]
MKNINVLNLRISVIAIILMFSSVDVLRSQNHSKRFFKGWAVNMNVGPNFYFGDVEINEVLAVANYNKEVQMAYGLILSKKLGSVVSLRGQLINGKLSGTKHYNSTYFESDIFEASLSTVINLSTLFFRLNSDNRRGSVYFTFGIGALQWKTELKDKYNNDIIINTEGYDDNWTNRRVIPIGLGFNYKLNHHWDINFETSLRTVNSDYLDATPSGNNDKYSYNSFGITYKFKKNKKKANLKIVSDNNEDILIYENTPDKEIVEQTNTKPDVINIANEESVIKTKTIEEQIIDAESEKEEIENPWQDVSFKVQILASQTRQNMIRFAKKYNITARIDENRVDKWYKYTIGEFPKYRKAKEYRNLLVSRNKIRDAFVIAYKNEEPITFHELMRGKRSTEVNNDITPNGAVQEGVIFSVQILAAKNLKITVSEFKEKYNIEEETRIQQFGDLYQLVSGNFTNYKKAKEFRRELIEKGIPDAFIVAYHDGVRISMENAFQIKKRILHD